MTHQNMYDIDIELHGVDRDIAMRLIYDTYLILLKVSNLSRENSNLILRILPVIGSKIPATLHYYEIASLCLDIRGRLVIYNCWQLSNESVVKEVR